MADGTATSMDATTFASSSNSLLDRLTRSGLRNTSVKVKSASTSTPRPTAMAAVIYLALRSYAITLLQYAQSIILYLQQQKGMWKSSWMASLSILSLGALMCFSVMYCYVTLNQRRRMASNNSLLNGEKPYMQESDDFDYEDDSDDDKSQLSGLAHPIRRFLNLRTGTRPGSSTRSSGIVRITSSDPRSSLSSVPIQLDMDSKSSVTPTQVIQDSSMVNLMQHSASVARRRRESGRLLNAVNNSGSNLSRTASPLGRSSPMRKVSSLGHSPSPSRLPRSSRSHLYKSGHETMSDTDLEHTRISHDSILVPSSSSQTFISAGIGFEEDEEDLVPMMPPSILVRQPKTYARKTKLHTSDLSQEVYSMNKNASGSAVWQSSSPTESGSEVGYSRHMPPPTTIGGARRLPPGAGHAPSSPLRSPPLHKLGSMDPAQIQAYWEERKSKSIRLQEPDWTPYVDVHIRAKERLETAAHVAANPKLTMLSPPPIQGLSSRLLADSSSVYGNDKGSHLLSDTEEEFWFERFTQSTAAAGRDWDWRKRRRQRQLANAARGDDEVLSNINGSIAESETFSNANNVGMTDVQLQKQRNEHAQKTSQIIKSSKDDNLRPHLSLSTSDTTLSRSNGQGHPVNRTTSTSPFGRRLKRYSSPGSDSLIDSPIREDGEAREVKQNGGGSGKKFNKSSGRKSSKRSTEADSDDADVSVPSRLSSLTPKMMKRGGLGAKRERDADLTKQLLAAAEEVATDEEDEDRGRAKQESNIAASSSLSSSPRGALEVRKSASSSNLGFSDIDAFHTEPIESINDSWSAGAIGGWSSADAYGTGPPQLLQLPVNPIATTQAASPLRLSLATSQNTFEYLLSGSEQLRRQGSRAESSHSSTSSHNSPLPVFALARSASRKGILSSANRAASVDSPRRLSEERVDGGSPMRNSGSHNSALYNNSLPLALPTQ